MSKERGIKPSRERPLDSEQARLSDFFRLLQETASENPGGPTTKAIRRKYFETGLNSSPGNSPETEPAYIELPPIEVEIQPLLDKHTKTWEEITQQLLVNPAKRKKSFGASIRDENIQLANVPWQIVTVEGDAIQLPLKFSNMTGVADLEPQDYSRFSPDPDEGRPGVSFKIVEIFTDSRRLITQIHERAISEEARIHADQSYLKKLLGLENPIIPASAGLKALIEKLDSTPLTVINLVSRVTFWDNQRKVFQPINLAGIRILETLDNTISVERLAPWERYDIYEPVSESKQRQIEGGFRSNFRLLDQNLTILANILKECANSR